MAIVKTTVFFAGDEVASEDVAGNLAPPTPQALRPAGEEVDSETIPGTPQASSPALASVFVGQELELVAHSAAFRSLAAVCEQVAADLDAKFVGDTPLEG